MLKLMDKEIFTVLQCPFLFFLKRRPRKLRQVCGGGGGCHPFLVINVFHRGTYELSMGSNLTQRVKGGNGLKGRRGSVEIFLGNLYPLVIFQGGGRLNCKPSRVELEMKTE